MTQQDIKEIEAALSIVLPKHYVEFMLDFPIALTLVQEEFDDSSFFYNNSKYLIKVNSFFGFHGQDKFIKNKLCIGENGGGDYYLINLEDHSDQEVLYLDHEESVEKFYDQEHDTWNWEGWNGMSIFTTLRHLSWKFMVITMKKNS
jgi:hypothetical protein